MFVCGDVRNWQGEMASFCFVAAVLMVLVSFDSCVFCVGA
jgi:hypothetical protein